jgi:hypothetical protein
MGVGLMCIYNKNLPEKQEVADLLRREKKDEKSNENLPSLFSAKQICKFLFFEQDFIVYAHQSNPHLFLMSSGIGCQRTKAPLNRAYYCS